MKGGNIAVCLNILTEVIERRLFQENSRKGMGEIEEISKRITEISPLPQWDISNYVFVSFLLYQGLLVLLGDSSVRQRSY